MLKKLKSVDLISLLLILFLASIPVVILTVKTINDNIQLFSKQSDTITTLKLLDKDFHYFASQKGIFSNYDIINRKIASFQHNLFLLKSVMKQNKKQHHYIPQINTIMQEFQTKTVLLEHVKSYNSIIINSLNYLHDLEQNIKQYSFLNQNEFRLIDETLFMSTQFYTNNTNTYKQIINNLQIIKQYANQRNDKYVNYFYQHEKSLVDLIENLKQEKHKVHNLNIYAQLDGIYKALQKDFKTYLFTGKIIMISIMLFLGILLLTIFYLHKKSLGQRKELHAYKYAIDNSDNSIVITDLDKKITYINDAFEKTTGYTKEEALGQNPRILKSHLLDQSHYDALNTALAQNKKWEGEFINKRKDGSIYYEKASIAPMFIDNKVIGYIAIKLNITKYVEQERKVKFLAYHDPLTSLPNRHQFEQFFTNTVIKEKRTSALLFIDLDHFKKINDTLGHHAGDELLKIFAQRLQTEISHKDFIARIGGDEFVAVLDTDNPSIVAKVAKRIIRSLENPMNVQNHQLNITTSIGVALFPQDGKTLNTLLKHADTAMYKAKTDGRNNFHFFTKALEHEVYERLTIEQELHHALDKNELYLVYQPKYNLHTQEIIGFEALVRWENAKLGFVPPDKFIHIAEEIGLINEIGYFVFESACRDFQKFSGQYDNLQHIAINVSTIQMHDQSFIANINEISHRTGIPPQQIEIELTESYLMKDTEQSILALKELRRHGYYIAIDDFGTGYSSFAYLKQLPITTLKIDKSFVDDICTEEKDKNIVKTIITLAQNLDFHTVAEGVEELVQESLLREMECMTGQGYLFSKPLKFDDAMHFLHSKQKQENADVS